MKDEIKLIAAEYVADVLRDAQRDREPMPAEKMKELAEQTADALIAAFKKIEAAD